ncbi:MAG: hypothetical protein R3D44_03980 [Hyphomicrobiaceae bacterium]
MIGINPDCPPGVALLADHLDSVLAVGEDLLGSSLPARADLDEADADAAPEALDAFVRRLLQLEASLVLRLLQARRLASEIGRADTTLKAAGALLRAQTDTLHDLIAGAGRTPDGMLVRAGDSHAYIRSRGLIAPEAAAPSPFESLSIGEDFRIGGVVQLGQILDMVSTMLDLIDARFGLYSPDLDEAVTALGGLEEVVASQDGESENGQTMSLAGALDVVRAATTAGFDVASDGGSPGEGGKELGEVRETVADSATAAAAKDDAEGARGGDRATNTPGGNPRSLTSRIAEIDQVP